MRFILVNGRRPASQSVCAACSRTMGAAYLRNLHTRLCYCDSDCYASSRPYDPGIGSVLQQQAGTILEPALTLLHQSRDADLAY
jgi:hypothetical protein